MNRCQVLDHEADFGGITGWCRALVGTKCFPIDQSVGLLVMFYLVLLSCIILLCYSQSIFQDEIDPSLLISNQDTVVEVTLTFSPT